MGNDKNAMEEHWQPLREAMAANGPQGVIDYIESHPAGDQLKIYNFAHRAFGGRDWAHGDAGKNFDDYIAVNRAAIDAALKRSDEADDPERAKELMGIASMFSFNLTANLAECWPGDDEPREERHLEEGLRAAIDCTVWGPEAGKPLDKQSTSWWAKGMHELSLKRYDDSIASFQKSLDMAHTAAGNDTGSLSVESTFGELLGEGYLGLAERAAGNGAGAERYDRAIELFTRQMDDESKKGDASFGIEQLEVVKSLVEKRLATQ